MDNKISNINDEEDMVIEVDTSKKIRNKEEDNDSDEDLEEENKNSVSELHETGNIYKSSFNNNHNNQIENNLTNSKFVIKSGLKEELESINESTNNTNNSNISTYSNLSNNKSELYAKKYRVVDHNEYFPEEFWIDNVCYKTNSYITIH